MPLCDRARDKNAADGAAVDAQRKFLGTVTGQLGTSYRYESGVRPIPAPPRRTCAPGELRYERSAVKDSVVLKLTIGLIAVRGCRPISGRQHLVGRPCGRRAYRSKGRCTPRTQLRRMGQWRSLPTFCPRTNEIQRDSL